MNTVLIRMIPPPVSTKSEYRNPKRFPKDQVQMTETLPPFGGAVWNIEISVIWICFEFRISEFEFPSRPPRRLVFLEHVIVVLDLEPQLVLGLLVRQGQEQTPEPLALGRLGQVHVEPERGFLFLHR